MADESHFNELLAQESDRSKRGLLEEFAKIIGSQNTDPADYPARVRKIMDKVFKEVIHALSP